MRLAPALLLLLAACAGPRPYVVDPLISFTDTGRLVLLSPSGHALEATLEDGGIRPWDVEYRRTLPRIVEVRAVEAFLYKIGPGDVHRFRPSGGVPDQEAMDRVKLPRVPVEGLRVRFTVKAASEMEVELSGFRAGDATYGPGASVAVPYRPPNP